MLCAAVLDSAELWLSGFAQRPAMSLSAAGQLSTGVVPARRVDAPRSGGLGQSPGALVLRQFDWLRNGGTRGRPGRRGASPFHQAEAGVVRAAGFAVLGWYPPLRGRDRRHQRRWQPPCNYVEGSARCALSSATWSREAA